MLVKQRVKIHIFSYIQILREINLVLLESQIYPFWKICDAPNFDFRKFQPRKWPNFFKNRNQSLYICQKGHFQDLPKLISRKI